MLKQISFSLVFAFLFSSAVADIIPPNSHPLERCIKVVNLDKFPGVVLIGYDQAPGFGKVETYQIKNNQCFTKGYKFDLLSVYWNTKKHPNVIEPNKLLLKEIESYGGYLDRSDPLIKENIEYSIAGFSDGKLVLYKSRHTSKYNNGTADQVEVFSNPLVNWGPNTVTPSAVSMKQTVK